MKLTMLGTGNALVTECYNTCFVIEDSYQSVQLILRYHSRPFPPHSGRWLTHLRPPGGAKCISPIWIMPKYRNKGYAQQAILAAEKIYGSDHWCLDTILQEEGNLHLYEKLGYHQMGRVDKINDRMNIVYYEKD